MAKCPKCEKDVSSPKNKDFNVNTTFSGSYTSVMYICPHCDTILGVAVDPTWLLKEIKRLK